MLKEDTEKDGNRSHLWREVKKTEDKELNIFEISTFTALFEFNLETSHHK